MTHDVLSDEFFNNRREELKGRVKKRRFEHSEGVAQTAEMLARTYGVSTPRKARLAGILHDWDKGYRDGEIKQRARDLGVDEEVGSWVVEHLPETLHGPTAARALARDFPDIPVDVLQAISKHTVGALQMDDLDKVLYVADALEPNRTFEGMEELRASVGMVSLDELFYQVYKFWTLNLIQRNLVLHPDTIDIWNSIAKGKSKAVKEKYQ